MESGSKLLPKPNAICRAPWLENQDRIRLDQQTGIPTPQLQLRFQHPFLHVTPQAWSSDANREPQHMARVEVVVQPTSMSSGKVNAENVPESRIKFSSPEDMAEMLFSSSKNTASLDSLYEHRDASHTALLDHKTAIDSLLAHKKESHEGLVSQRNAINSLLTHKKESHEGLVSQRNAINSLLTHKKESHEGLVSQRNAIQKLQTHKTVSHEALLQHKSMIEDMLAFKNESSEAIQDYKIELASTQDIIAHIEDHIGGVDNGLSRQAKALSNLEKKTDKTDSSVKTILQNVKSLDQKIALLCEKNKYLPTDVKNELRTVQLQVKKLASKTEDIDAGMILHTKILAEHSQKNSETQARLSNTESNLAFSAQKSVDVSLLAPRKRS